MLELQKEITKKHIKQKNDALLKCVNTFLGREIMPDDYKDFELISGIGMDKTIVYKGEKVGEIKTEITFELNGDDFINNSITCTCITTYKLL